MPIFDDHLADLPLSISSYELERLEEDVSSGFHRVSTRIRLTGGDTDGVGEDVSYAAEDQDAAQAAGTIQPLAGDWTLASFCDHVEQLDLWPEPARQPAAVNYRIWAYESAALDLALRQSGKPLHEALGRPVEPLTFVVSIRLGEPSTLQPLRKRLDAYPTLRFKLDPTNDWSDDLVAELVATGAVDSLDFKGYYSGTPVDSEPDPALYKRVIEAFPNAWLEDPHEALYDVVEPDSERVTWDAPIHSIADIESRRWPPKMVNIKPSRFGALRSLFATYEYCEANSIGMYGGGQFELAEGRDQIQYLAGLFHASGPNDVAPSAFNLDNPPAGLPDSPLMLHPAPTGFRLA